MTFTNSLTDPDYPPLRYDKILDNDTRLAYRVTTCGRLLGVVHQVRGEGATPGWFASPPNKSGRGPFPLLAVATDYLLHWKRDDR